MDDIKPALQELSESSSSSISISTTSSISSTTTSIPPSSTTTHDANAAALTTPSWPRIGSVVAETEIPAAWRKTKLQSEMQHQYVFLGAVCGIFFVGVLGVLMAAGEYASGSIRTSMVAAPRRNGVLLAKSAVAVEVTESAKGFLAETGYDPKFGARPLARAIRRYIENPLSSRIIGGEFDPGDTIIVDRAEGEEGLTFRTKVAATQ